jgi:hypothetical protein
MWIVHLSSQHYESIDLATLPRSKDPLVVFYSGNIFAFVFLPQLRSKGGTICQQGFINILGSRRLATRSCLDSQRRQTMFICVSYFL